MIDVDDKLLEELKSQDPTGRLYNDDLRPASHEERNWSFFALFALWMNDAHNAGNYTFAAGLFIAGLSPISITLGIMLGCFIIFFGCVASGFMGFATGTPYPVISRMTWGIWGANIPAIVRGIVAIGWYGIQTYLASIALKVFFLRVFPSWEGMLDTSFLGLDLVGWIAFLTLSAVQLAVVWRGMEAVRHFQGAAGPVIWLVMIALAVWMLWQSGWHIDMFHGETGPDAIYAGKQVYGMFVAMGLTVGTLATLMLNFSDFARYAPSKKAIVHGNLWGLPLNWTAFALTSVITSAAAMKVYGEAILDPGDLINKIENNVIFFFGTLAFVTATVGVNIVANYVSASFDLSNVNPRRISFKRGGIITAVVSVLVTPWNLFNSPAVISYFLGSMGALLGPFFGILVADFFFIRKGMFEIKHMYLPTPESIYYYYKGFNGIAALALIPSAAVSLTIALVPYFSAAAPFGWFIGAPLGFIFYALFAKNRIKVVADAVKGAPQVPLG